jgi:hypothetical protein
MLSRCIAIFIVSLLLGSATQAQPSASSVVGRWQYIQPPDSEGEVLDIALSGDRYTGIMNGLERAGEHGLFYYVVELSNLVIAADGNVRFTVGPRSFNRQRPALSTLGAKGDGGSTRESMVFSGRLEGSELVLRCEGPGSSCPDSVLRFKKLSAKDQRRR